MADIYITHELRYLGKVLTDRTRERPITFSPDTDHYLEARNVDIADKYGVVTLWSSGDAGMTTFTLALAIADRECLIELHDASSNISIVRPLKKNIPLYIHNSKVKAAVGDILTDGSETTSFDNIDRVRVQRNTADASGNALVEWFIFE